MAHPYDGRLCYLGSTFKDPDGVPAFDEEDIGKLLCIGSNKRLWLSNAMGNIAPPGYQLYTDRNAYFYASSRFSPAITTTQLKTWAENQVASTVPFTRSTTDYKVFTDLHASHHTNVGWGSTTRIIQFTSRGFYPYNIYDNFPGWYTDTVQLIVEQDTSTIVTPLDSTMPLKIGLASFDPWNIPDYLKHPSTIRSTLSDIKTITSTGTYILQFATPVKIGHIINGEYHMPFIVAWFDDVPTIDTGERQKQYSNYVTLENFTVMPHPP